MHPIDSPGAVAGHFVTGNYGAGIKPTGFTAAWADDLQWNLINVLTAAGIPWVKGDFTQLTKAVAGNSPLVYLSSFATLQDALTFIGSTTRVLCIDTDQAFAGTATIPANVTVVHYGGRLAFSVGAILNINGKVLFSNKHVFNFNQAPADKTARVYFGPGSITEARPEWFGALPGTVAAGYGSDFDCHFIQLAALSLSEGGIVRLSQGVYGHAHAWNWTADSAVEIPDNVSIIGAGQNATFIRKQAVSRTASLNLLVNARIGVATAYNGGSNILLSDFGIDAGDPTPNATQGDLIGLGHGKGILVERIKFGSHDQSGIRISGCFDVTVRDCTFENDVNQAAATPIRIERAVALANPSDFIGCNMDNTDCEKISIEHNSVVNSLASYSISQRSGTLYRSTIQSNFISNTANIIGHVGIHGASGALMTNCRIADNLIKMTAASGPSCFGMWFNQVDGSNNIIENNSIVGVNMRAGIYYGPTAWNAAYAYGIMIHNNNLDLNNTAWENAVRYHGIAAFHTEASIAGNRVILRAQSTNPSAIGNNGITADSCERAWIENNRISMFAAITQPYQNSYGIMVKVDASAAALVLSTVSVGQNFVSGSYRVHIGQDDTYQAVFGTHLKMVISGNRTSGAAYRAHYFDSVGACDGTNDVELYDFTAYGGTKSYLVVNPNASYPSGTTLFAWHRLVSFVPTLVSGGQPRLTMRMRYSQNLPVAGGQTVWHDMRISNQGAADLRGAFLEDVRCTDNGSGNVPATCGWRLNTGANGVCVFPTSATNHGATTGGAGYIMVEVGI